MLHLLKQHHLCANPKESVTSCATKRNICHNIVVVVFFCPHDLLARTQNTNKAKLNINREA